MSTTHPKFEVPKPRKKSINYSYPIRLPISFNEPSHNFLLTPSIFTFQWQDGMVIPVGETYTFHQGVLLWVWCRRLSLVCRLLWQNGLKFTAHSVWIKKLEILTELFIYVSKSLFFLSLFKVRQQKVYTEQVKLYRASHKQKKKWILFSFCLQPVVKYFPCKYCFSKLYVFLTLYLQ